MAETKRICRRISLGVGVSIIASALLYADLKKGYYTPSQLGSLQQVAGPQLAPGDGLQEVRIYCNTCHSPRYITMQPPLPAATWKSEVNKMNKEFGASIPEDTSSKIVSYLQAHYALENRR
jgi:mono/diheme cytochrome c family protein